MTFSNFWGGKRFSFNGAEYRPDFVLHVLDGEVADDGQGAIGRVKISSVKIFQLFESDGFETLFFPVNGLLVGMSFEQILVDKGGREAERIILELADLFEDDFFFGVDLRLDELEVEQNFLLILKGEIGEVGGERDFESGQVLGGVSIEIGAMTANIPADFAAAADLGPAE